MLGMGQEMVPESRFSQPVNLDSIVVKTNFDVNAFIRRVQRDTTFYKAFKSMHFVPYDAVNEINVYDRSGDVIASLKSRTKQEINNKCRVTKIKEHQCTGNFFKKNGDYNFFTASLYAFLFFAPEPVCNENDIVEGSLEIPPKGEMEKCERQLKQLIFNPGSKVSGVPFMGDRASVFDEDEAKKYDFRIVSSILDGQDCFVFSLLPKPGFEKKVLFDELTTWFRKGDYSIIARNYSLSYHTLFYDFDVKMKVRTTRVNGKLYPERIDYDGNWHIFTKKREQVKFLAIISY